MPNWLLICLIYLTPLAVIVLFYLRKKNKQHRDSQTHLQQAKDDGLTESASLHPIIDPLICIGCGSCVSACPEKSILGLVYNKAALINPSNCIGHGACKTACPEKAIELVFGSATRGIEIPEVNPNYETCISGVFIAGELGGMGLIRNAIEQGRQAMDGVIKYIEPITTGQQNVLDCIIVGAGPAGLTASLGAKEVELNFITIDQDLLGGTIAHFPKGKLVMTQTATVPLVGPVKFGEISKEKLMKFWIDITNEHDININYNEVLLDIINETDELHRVITSKTEYLTKSVILAIGRRGTPRKLEVAGEELHKVSYRLVDANQYQGMSVLVVGGGDSAIEAACSLAEQNNTSVHLSYRKETFGRAKAKNRERIDSLEQSGKLTLLFSSQVVSMDEHSVTITKDDQHMTIDNQAIIICVGGILPTKLLTAIGVKVVKKYGTL